MRKSFLFALFCSIMSITALKAEEAVQMDNMRASLQAETYVKSKFLEKVDQNGKTYVVGKASSYNRNGEANGGRLVWPYAEYEIQSKMMGGSYHVTVHYRVDKDKLPDTPQVVVGMDLVEPQTLDLNKENKLFNSVKGTFKVSLLKGKKHNVKIWLPSEGVMIDKIEVRKAIFNKKDKDKE